MIDIDAEFDHALDTTVWQNRLRRINFRGDARGEEVCHENLYTTKFNTRTVYASRSAHMLDARDTVYGKTFKWENFRG